MRVPILKLGDILMTSIQLDLTDQDALEFQSDVLNKVSETDAKGIVLDITALEVVDSFLARVLNETANMVRLLGAETVICGMQPAVALTLVGDRELYVGSDHPQRLEERIRAAAGDQLFRP